MTYVGIMAKSKSCRKNENAETGFLKTETEEVYADEKKRQAAQPLYLKRYE